MTITRIDYNQLSIEYARHRRVHPQVLNDLFSSSNANSTFKILEVGCGTGNYIRAIRALTGCACWGLDPSEQMLSRAREGSTGIHFQQGQAEELNFETSTFDLLFSVDVIHHVGDRGKYYREAHRVLKPGARLCTVTDSAEIIRRRQPLSVYFPESVEPELARYPRITELQEFMERAGFGEIVGKTVEFPYQLTDLQPYRDKAFSSLHLISGEAHQAGIARMEKDLRRGPIPCVSLYTLLWGLK